MSTLGPTDRFAELLSQGLTMKEVASVLGLTANGAKAAMRRIKAQLGSQAT